MPAIFDIPLVTLDARPTTLAEHAGKVLLIVNTASKCGLTPQLTGLEELQRLYGGRGFTVLGFPCNQFGAQEPGTADEIGAFCQKNYGVSFPMYEKIEVNGPGTHPLFAFLKESAPGLLASKGIKWNFTKFLVGRDGEVLARYAPATSPLRIRGAIERALRAGAPNAAYTRGSGGRVDDEQLA